MTRINTNISSLIAQTNLSRSNDVLQQALTRLSTGLRINTGKDDPAGLIASEILRSDINATQKAISNTQRANQIIGTADSALNQVSSLLNDLRGLIDEAANTGALSDAQIQANQLQVDSSLAAIDRISQTTSFQGRRLLDGSLDFITSGLADGQAAITVAGAVDVNASQTVADVLFTANTAGTQFTVVVNTGATAGSETATRVATTITISIATGATSASDIATIVNANSNITSFLTASTSSTAIQTAVASTTTTNGVNGNSFIITATTPGTQFNGATITISAGATATGSETASYNTATNTLTVVATSTSTANQIITAINAEGTFSANLLNSNGLGTGVATGNSVLTGATLGSSGINNLRINQANFGTSSAIAVQVDVDTQATQATLTYSGGALASAAVLEIGGDAGFNTFNFGSGTTLIQLRDGINLLSDTTGVTAAVSGGDLVLTSSSYGSDAFVSARALSGSFNTGDGSGNALSRSNGTDAVIRINGLTATVDGLDASLNSATLNLSFTIASSLTAGNSLSFSIDGGGANFQLGPDVISSQQSRIGIQSVSTARLGGLAGRLYELTSGGAKALDTDARGASAVITEVITQVTTLRGRLGAFQRTTLDSNIATLSDTLAGLTDAQSSIRDADFAVESANLTRAQILVQAGTTVLAISNQRPQSILNLLR